MFDLRCRELELTLNLTPNQLCKGAAFDEPRRMHDFALSPAEWAARRIARATYLRTHEYEYLCPFAEQEFATIYHRECSREASEAIHAVNALIASNRKGRN